MPTCNESLTSHTKPEHILVSALGGRKSTTRADCSRCNGTFGSTIDKAVTEQVAVLRNMLGLESGAGKPPPALRKVKAGSERIPPRRPKNEPSAGVGSPRGRPSFARIASICPRQRGSPDLLNFQ